MYLVEEGARVPRSGRCTEERRVDLGVKGVLVEEGVPGRGGCTSEWKVYRGEEGGPGSEGCTL